MLMSLTSGFGRARIGALMCCVALTGCPGPSATLEIIEPADGTVLTTADDTSAILDGIQTRIVVQAIGVAVGADVDLVIDDGAIAATAVTPDDGMIVYEDVTVPAGQHTLRAVTRRDDTRSPIVTIEVRDVCFPIGFVTPAPMGTSVTLGPSDDTDGEACGETFETTVVVSTGAPNGSEARIIVNGAPQRTATVASGVVRFTGVAFDRRGTMANELRVEITGPEGVACPAMFPGSIFVDCQGVSCSITSPDAGGGFLNQDDDVSDAPGFQGDFEVTTDPDGAGQEVRLIVDGNETGARSALPVGNVATFGNVPLSEGVHRVQAECRDSAGNVSRSAAAEWTVDTIACELDLTTPTPGTLYTDDDDLDATVDGIQVDASGTAAADCTQLRVELCSAIEAAPFGGAETDWTRRVTLGSSPTQEICVQALDMAGNVSTDRESVRLRTEAPQLEIVAPAAGSEFNIAGNAGRTADLMAGNSTCEVFFDVYCTDVGVDVVVERSDTMIELGRTACVAEAGLPAPYSGRATFPMLSLPSVQTGAAFPVVAWQEADRLRGASAAISLRSDCVAPPVAVARPACGSTLLLATHDEDLTTPGLQHRTNINNPIDPAEDVVLEIRPVGGGSPTYMATDTTTTTTAIFTAASYGAGGELEILATVVDSAGNVGTTAGCTVTVSDLPSLVVTQPMNGAALGTDADCDTSRPGMQVRVRATTNAADGSMGEVRTDDGEVVMQSVTGGVIDVCIDVPEGPVTFTVSVTDSRGTSTAMTMVRIDTMPPTTAIEPLAVSTVDRRGGRVRLSWTAVADAGGGSLSSYHLRCSATPITNETEWSAATVVSLMTTPGTAGTSESEEVRVVRPGETVHCVLRGADVVGQLTPLPSSSTAVTTDFLEATVTPTMGTSAGTAVTPIGDVNGDSIDDLLIGGDGIAYLYFGSTSGLGAAPNVNIVGPAGVNFGMTIAGIGDFNGDGHADFAIGARLESAARGSVYVFFGRPATSSWPSNIDVSSGCGTVGAPTPGGCMVLRGDDGAAGGPDEPAALGWSLSSAGDFDGDGLFDLAIGASVSSSFVGRTYVILGRASHARGATVLVPGPDGGQPAGFVMQGDGVTYRAFGTSVASVGGDMDGDGRHELLVSATGGSGAMGTAVAVLGRAHTGTGLVTIPTTAFQLLGTGTANQFGRLVRGVGDVDNDGRLDAAVQNASSAGSITVFFGGPSGFVSPASVVVVNDLAGAASDDFGGSIGTGVHPWLMRIGDVDRDGIVDLLAGAAQTGTGPGTAHLFYREASRTAFPRSSAHVEIGPATAIAAAGYAGDLNGDGFTDIVVGDPAFGSGTGRVLVRY